MNISDYLNITEHGGERVTKNQLNRFFQRYIWAGNYCNEKDVLELACGTGPGLGYLHSVARSLKAGDISPDAVRIAKDYYKDRLDISCFDAVNIPFEDSSFDVVIMFEAIYYISDISKLLLEVSRVLRPQGLFLLATANKDLYDFNPSPYSYSYFNPPELCKLLSNFGFTTFFYGGSDVKNNGPRLHFLRYVKKIASHLKLIPMTMAGKRILKRIIYGRLVEMPFELNIDKANYISPIQISAKEVDTNHLVLYCLATKES